MNKENCSSKLVDEIILYVSIVSVWGYIRIFCACHCCRRNRWLKSTVLYCIVLYCTVLYCIVLHCTVLYCTVLHCTLLYCIVLYYTVLYCTVLYCTVLYYTVLYCIVLYSTTPVQASTSLTFTRQMMGRKVGRVTACPVLN